MAISTSVADAFRLFAGLEEQPVWNELPQLSTSKLFLIEELGRFRIWSGNIGAHKSGRSSLDYRLRDNTRLERTVLQLLDDLKTSLEDGKSLYHI